jgi:hypothetical protein
MSFWTRTRKREPRQSDARSWGEGGRSVVRAVRHERTSIQNQKTGNLKLRAEYIAKTQSASVRCSGLIKTQTTLLRAQVSICWRN